MIEMRHLVKQFGPFTAVDGVSFRVERGEVLGFLGPNGAGKSTTMKMATGFLTPTSGTAVICGHDVVKDPQAVKEAIGYLPEGAPAYPDMTPEGFLGFVAEIRGLTDRLARTAAQTAPESAVAAARTGLALARHEMVFLFRRGRAGAKAGRGHVRLAAAGTGALQFRRQQCRRAQ